MCQRNDPPRSIWMQVTMPFVILITLPIVTLGPGLFIAWCKGVLD